MYAIIQTGGKQYKVEPGMTIKVEKLSGEVGEQVRFDRVLMVSDGSDIKIGQPTVEGAVVYGRVVEQGRGRKIIVFKYKRRKNYRRKKGHRQYYTSVRIETIGTDADKEHGLDEIEQ